MVEPDYGRDERQRLISELKRLRRRSIWRVESPGRRVAIDLSLLSELALSYAGSNKTLSAAVEALIRAAVAELPSGLTQNTAVGIFRLDGDPGVGKPTDWRKEVRETLYPHQTINTYEDETEPAILDAIAAQIQVLCRSSLSNVPISPVSGYPTLLELPSSVDTPYVPRPRLDQAFANAVQNANKGSRRVFVAGDTGTGKTRFITEWVRDLCSEGKWRIIWISAVTSVALRTSLVEFLESEGKRTTGSDEAVLRFEFTRFLCECTDWTTIVVVDDIDDPDCIGELIPSDAPCYAVIISRLRPSDETWPQVVIPDMEITEATAMLSAQWPNMDPIQGEGLALALGSRPQLLDNACNFLRKNTGLGVADLAQALAADTSAAIDAIAPRSIEALTVVYRELVNRIASRHPASMRLLELLSFVSPVLVPKEYLGAYLLGKSYLKTTDVAVAGIQLESALRPLVENCVVSASALGVIQTPFVVQAIMQEILKDRMDVVVAEARSMRTRPIDLYAEGWQVITVVGRKVCENVLRRRLEDQRSEKTSEQFDSARWFHLIHGAWEATLDYEMMSLALLILAPTKYNVPIDAFSSNTREDFRTAMRSAPQLLREDAELAIYLGERMERKVMESGFDIKGASSHELAEHMHRQLNDRSKRNTRYIDSPFGQIDLATLVPSFSLPSKLPSPHIRALRANEADYRISSS